MALRARTERNTVSPRTTASRRQTVSRRTPIRRPEPPGTVFAVGSFDYAQSLP